MKLIRFIPTPDGGSQFVEVDIPIDNSPTDAFGHVVRRSATLTAQSTMLTEMAQTNKIPCIFPASREFGLHGVPSA